MVDVMDGEAEVDLEEVEEGEVCICNYFFVNFVIILKCFFWCHCSIFPFAVRCPLVKCKTKDTTLFKTK